MTRFLTEHAFAELEDYGYADLEDGGALRRIWEMGIESFIRLNYKGKSPNQMISVLLFGFLYRSSF